MRRQIVVLGMLLGLALGSCSETAEPFECGDEQCDRFTEYCSVDPNCDGVDEPTAVCVDLPEDCQGRRKAKASCVDALFCDDLPDGGISCSGACG